MKGLQIDSPVLLSNVHNWAMTIEELFSHVHAKIYVLGFLLLYTILCGGRMQNMSTNTADEVPSGSTQQGT